MKRITSQVAIGGTIEATAPNTFTESIISIPLSALDRQGFVVQEVYIMSQEPIPIAGLVCNVDIRVSKTSQTDLIDVSNPMLIGSQQKRAYFLGTSTDMFESDLAINPTSEGQSDYITILATTNAFIQIVGTNNGFNETASVRLVGYFAELGSDEYNALVLDELQ
jgi:hypothetical protein